MIARPRGASARARRPRRRRCSRARARPRAARPRAGRPGRPRRRRRCRPRSARSPRPPGDRSRRPAPGAKPSFAAAIERTPEPQPTSSTLPRSSLLEQLQAELRRRMAAGAEGAARVDHDRGRVLVGSLPGRADPERADADRLVELAPAVLPVLLDVGGGRAAERLPDPLLAGGVRVRRELERAAVAAELLEALGEQLQHDRARLLRPGVGDGDGHTPEQRQRIAFLSFSKKPSSRR